MIETQTPIYIYKNGLILLDGYLERKFNDLETANKFISCLNKTARKETIIRII